MPQINTIETIIATAIERRIFPGAVVLIARAGDVLHSAPYGSTMYDAPDSRPVTIDTIYDVASLTKMFTATAALRLIDQGRLTLHAPVKEYLPQMRSPDITILHLLTHTSGLDIRLSALRNLRRGEFLAAVYDIAPQRPPGAAVAYTNVNSLLLGEIIAALHKTPLDIALNDLAIAPLGLRDTCFLPPRETLPRIAPTEVDETWRGGLVHGSVHDESTHALGGVAGHAGLFSTVKDLFRFCSTWLESIGEKSQLNPSSFLSYKTARLATTNHTPHLHAACGLGWMMDRPNFMGEAPAGSFGHTGFTGPAMVVVPQHQLIVIVLSNRVYPQRGAPEHHGVTAALVEAAIRVHE
jgi:CubicO group peptidase (beta-lactamase class C family)